MALSARILLSSALFSSFAVATAAPIRLVSITSAALTPDRSAISVSFAKPCQFDFYGIVAQKVDGRRLELAVAGTMKNMGCIGLPKMMTVRVDAFALTGIEAFGAMAMDGGNDRVELVEILDVGLNQSTQFGTKAESANTSVATKQMPSASLEASYITACGSFAGVVVRSTDRGKQGLGLMEWSVRRPPATGSGLPSTCPYTQVSRELPALSPAALTRGISLIRPTSLATTDATQQYYLRLSQTQIESRAASQLNLRFQRRCNEAPVGVVVSALDATNTIAVGMLVAHYYNMPCEQASAGDSMRWSTYSQSIVLDPKASLRPMLVTANDRGRLRVKAPLRLQREPSQSHTMFSFYAPCGRTIGAVYATDSLSRVAVGILEQRSSVAACVGAAREKTLMLPASMAAAPMPTAAASIRPRDAAKTYPLRIRGQATL